LIYYGIQGTRQYGLHFSNHAAMADLKIRVVNSRLSGAKGPAVVAVDQDGSTEHSDMDLGGKPGRGPGGNCIVGGTNLAAEVSGYDVFAKSDWWGHAGGPAAREISVTDGHLHTAPARRAPPPSCREQP
jgi:hypothetical protein